MKTLINKILVITIITFSLNSCVTILSPSNQEIVIENSNNKTKVVIDEKNYGTGKEVKITLPKDMNFHQVKLELDSHKTNYKVINPDKISKNYYLSVVCSPFAFLLPLFEGIVTNKILVYEDKYQFNEQMFKYPIWNSNYKKLYMNNLSAELSKDSNLFKFYYRDDYLDNSKPRLDEKNDSLNFTNTTFEDNIENILKKSNFTDTTNTIFVDNINSMLISGKISKLNLNEVSSSSSMTRGKKEIYHFLTSDLSTTWYLTNMYGDTIFKKYISNRSGEMIANEDNYKVASQNVFKDAIETSFLKFFEDTKVQELLKKETTLNEKYEKIVINKNHQNPKNLDEAMQASFTIKLKEGHGSGFLVSNDGYIITNHHVINKENNIKAVDQNGKEFELKVIRSNKNLDLALCKIEGDFKFAFNLPNEKNFDIGSDIFAVGTPKSIELGQSITKGVVSGYRTNTFNNSKIVQTDAKINRGNSGGAIITNNGNLVGVVDYKIFGVGVEGLSFAIGATEIKTALGIE